jgi:hypothetical protein
MSGGSRACMAAPYCDCQAEGPAAAAAADGMEVQKATRRVRSCDGQEACHGLRGMRSIQD